MITEHLFQLRNQPRLLPALSPAGSGGLVPDIEHTLLLPLTLAPLCLLALELARPPPGLARAAWRTEAFVVLSLGLLLAPLPLTVDPADDAARAAFALILALCATAALLRYAASLRIAAEKGAKAE